MYFNFYFQSWFAEMQSLINNLIELRKDVIQNIGLKGLNGYSISTKFYNDYLKEKMMQ